MGDQPDSKNTMQEDKTEILKEKKTITPFQSKSHKSMLHFQQ